MWVGQTENTVDIWARLWRYLFNTSLNLRIEISKMIVIRLSSSDCLTDKYDHILITMDVNISSLKCGIVKCLATTSVRVVSYLYWDVLERFIKHSITTSMKYTTKSLEFII